MTYIYDGRPALVLRLLLVAACCCDTQASLHAAAAAATSSPLPAIAVARGDLGAVVDMPVHVSRAPGRALLQEDTPAGATCTNSAYLPAPYDAQTTCCQDTSECFTDTCSQNIPGVEGITEVACSIPFASVS